MIEVGVVCRVVVEVHRQSVTELALVADLAEDLEVGHTADGRKLAVLD